MKRKQHISAFDLPKYKDEFLTREYFEELHKYLSRNGEIADLYEQLADYAGGNRKHILENRALSVRCCMKYISSDYYMRCGVKDIQRVNLCRDKFCFNCQSMLAIKRMMKYTPIIDKLYDDYEIFHMVITIPNVYGDELWPAVERMFKRFKYFTRFLSGDKKIHLIPFDYYGYSGLLRGFEITQNADGMFHPHFHCILALRKGIELKKYRCNKFTYDKQDYRYKGREPRLFSDFEILLQKIWKLVYDGETVTKTNIDALKLGYSVVVDPCPKGEYHEIFKYAFKGTFKEIEYEDGTVKDGIIYTYDIFWALYYALFRRHLIQSYGIFHGLIDENEQIFEEEVTQFYEAFIKDLKRFEDPKPYCEPLQDIVKDERNKYVSKFNFARMLRARKDEERKD